MGRIVYAPINQLAGGTDADQDIFILIAGSANKCILHGFEITSDTTSAAALTLELLRRSTDGTGGTAATEVKADEDDGAITAAMTYGRTAPGTAGDILATFQWEQLGPLTFLPTPEMRPKIQESGRLALHLGTSPASATIDGWVCWEEI